MEKSTLEISKELLESPPGEAEIGAFRISKGTGYAILAVAEQLDRLATIAEAWAQQPK